MSPLVPLLLALGFCFMIAISSMIARLVIKRGRMSSLQYSADVMLTQNLVFTTLAYLHHQDSPYSPRELYSIGLASVIACIAGICLNGALTYGKAGPVQALVQLQSPTQLMLELIVYAKVPSVLGLCGMGVSTFGAMVIILSK